MFPVQGTLDRTILWSDKEYFQPSWHELSNAFCKRLLIAYMADMRCSDRIRDYYQGLPAKITYIDPKGNKHEGMDSKSAIVDAQYASMSLYKDPKSDTPVYKALIWKTLPYELWMHIFYYCGDRYLRPSSMTIFDIVSASGLGIPESIEKLRQRIEYEEMIEPVLFPRV